MADRDNGKVQHPLTLEPGRRGCVCVRARVCVVACVRAHVCAEDVGSPIGERAAQ